VLRREPDVVCLQEVTSTTLERWTEALAPMRVQCTLPEERRLAVLLAARDLEPAPPPPVERPETVQAGTVGGTLVVCAHVPNAANGWVKAETLQVLGDHLAATSGPRVLAGDLNTPRKEHADGTVWTFARDGRGRLRPERGERWDAGERAPWESLDDAFRRLHPPGDGEISWAWRRWKGGYRLDHVLVSDDVEVERCEYRHHWRLRGMSDHSPLEADLRVASAR
jgi:endonuclease/exonuclease/phosphatase family metal-dependent hydrolase